MGRCTFLTNHAYVLLCIATDPAVRLREVSARVGITERATQRIVADLCDSGYVTRTRVGRRNQYELHTELPFRRTLDSEPSVGSLLRVMESRAPGGRGADGELASATGRSA